VTITNSPSPRLLVAAQSPAHRALLACGLIGAVLFNATYFVAGALRPGYDTVRDTISDLSLGPAGWVQITNFVVFGLLVIAFAAGLRISLASGPVAAWVPALQVLGGFGLIVAGVVVTGTGPADHSVHNTVHTVATIVSLSSRAAGALVLAPRFARTPGWRGWPAYAVATAAAMIIVLAVFGHVTSATGGGGGILEKTGTLIGSLFVALLAARLLSRHPLTIPGRR
jgi:hypothetical membrane protein